MWYWRRDKGTYEFFDSAGFHQSTGERLEIVTREIIDTWRKHSESASQKCYVITRDAVRYGDRPGIDPSTGRQCRTVTEDLLERLREYEKGNRPKRIDATSPLFFDLRSGEPIVWYRTNNDGVVELFDLMGFHAETGDELLPVTREIADLWRKQTEEKQRRIPQLIDIGQYAPFDPLTGAPRVWYWRSDKGDYEFYDSAGFHPHTGEPLGLLTREIIAKREEEILQRKREEQKQAEADQRRSPQRVDLDQYAPFDPLTGAPRVWYWRSDKGAYEFFDSAGFHPSTGEPLSALTRETIKKREAEAHEKARNRNGLKSSSAPSRKSRSGANAKLSKRSAPSRKIGSGASAKMSKRSEPSRKIRSGASAKRSASGKHRQPSFAINSRAIRMIHGEPLKALVTKYCEVTPRKQRSIASWLSSVFRRSLDFSISLQGRCNSWIARRHSKLKRGWSNSSILPRSTTQAGSPSARTEIMRKRRSFSAWAPNWAILIP